MIKKMKEMMIRIKKAEIAMLIQFYAKIRRLSNARLKSICLIAIKIFQSLSNSLNEKVPEIIVNHAQKSSFEQINEIINKKIQQVT